MKKKIVIVILIIFMGCLLNANFAFDIGYYCPQDADNGIIWGYDWFKVIDERVHFGVMGNIFYRNYTATRTLTIDDDKIKANSDLISMFLPLMLGVQINFMDTDIRPFAGGGIGWSIGKDTIFNAKYDSQALNIHDTRFFSGFTWQINSGAKYSLGKNSELYGKVFYAFSPLKHSADKSNTSVMRYKNLDMSGVGISIGLRMIY